MIKTTSVKVGAKSHYFIDNANFFRKFVIFQYLINQPFYSLLVEFYH